MHSNAEMRRTQRTTERLFRLIALCLGLLLLSACDRPKLQHQEAYVFGTRVEVLVADTDAEKGRAAVATVLREFDRMHASYHAWKPSELYTLNQALHVGKKQQVSPELAAFIKDAQDLAKKSDYLFDPGIGQLIGIWGFQSDEFQARQPDPNALAAWLRQKPSIADIEVNNLVISSRNPAGTRFWRLPEGCGTGSRR